MADLEPLDDDDDDDWVELAPPKYRPSEDSAPVLDPEIDATEFQGMAGASGFYLMDTNRKEDMEFFIGALAERFLGRQVGYLEEMKTKHLGNGERTSFAINAPAFMLGPGNLEIMKVLGVEKMQDAFAQDNRGDKTEATFTEFQGRSIMTWGTWATSINGANVCISAWEGNGECDFTFYYSKENEAALMGTLISIKKSIEDFIWFSGKNMVFSSGDLTIVQAPKTKMADIVLDDKLRTSIEDNSIYYLRNLSTIIENGLYARRGILLSGPPGNGKTMLCRAINGEAPPGTTTIWVTGGSITQTDHITLLFKVARALAPCLLLFEDIDTLAGSRASTGRTYPLLGEMLTQMDGIGDTKGIIVVATTNYPEMVDTALKDRPRRFDRHYQIPMPDKQGRMELLRRSLPAGNTIAQDELGSLAERMGNASAATVEEVVHTARMNAMRSGETLNYSHLLAATNEVKRYEEGLTSSPSFL